MKIIHLLQSHRFSGAENVVCQIIGLMNDDSVEMLYCSRDGQIREALEERNITFIPIKDLTKSEVKRVIKEYKPDLIHAHDMRASFIAARVAGNIPIISHIHNNNFDSRGFSLKSIAYLYAGMRAKHIFWVSDSSFQGYAFHQLLKGKSEILYNIIDIDALRKKMSLDANQYNYDVVYLGRLTAPKNPIRLMRIFRQLIDIKPDIKIAVVGTGELEAETLAEANKLNLGKNVSFLGFQSNPYRILHDSKVMILTSLWEGTPMCVLEAMSLGTPVVSTPTDGVKVVVDNGRTGFLSDSDDVIVESCCRIIDDPDLRLNLSAKSKDKAKELMDSEKYKHRLMLAYGNK